MGLLFQAVKYVTRLPLAPTPGCCRTPALGFRSLFIDEMYTYKTFELLILLKKTLISYLKYSNQNDSIVRTHYIEVELYYEVIIGYAGSYLLGMGLQVQKSDGM
jgi:hypothetical protein